MSGPEIQAAKESVAPSRPAAPLLPIALGLIAGIVADFILAPPTWVCAGLLFVGMGVLVLGRGRPGAPITALTLAAVATGALRHAVSERWLPADHIVTWTRSEPVLARVTGRVLGPPAIVKPPADVPRAYPIGPKTIFLLEAAAVEGEGGVLGACGRVRVSI
ncbi:MAG: hypothetical protein ACE5E1_10920, partial [Phycisphaerae bacterium]